MSSTAESKDSENASSLQCIDISNFKSGQKYPTPSPGNGDRVFYETLLKQKPESEMAMDWCLSYGVLEASEAERLHDYILKRKKKGVTTVPPVLKKTPVPINESKTKTTGQKRSRRISEDDDDEDSDG